MQARGFILLAILLVAILALVSASLRPIASGPAAAASHSDETITREIASQEGPPPTLFSTTTWQDAVQPAVVTDSQSAVVRFQDSLSPGEQEEALARLLKQGARISGHLPGLNTYRLDLPPTLGLEDLASQLPEADLALDTIFALPQPVEIPTTIEEGASLTGTPFFGRDYLDAIGLTRTDGTNLRPVKVAIIDSGIAAGMDGLFSEAQVTRAGSREASAPPEEGVGHGTAMAAIIGGQLDGAAPGATLIDLPVLSETGEGSAFDVAEAVLEATRQGADIINLSLGAYVNDPTLESAIAAAEQAGVTVVAASGNDGFDQVAYPAAYESVVGVGASQRTGMRADFSNGGDNLDVLAPGTGLQVRLSESNAIELSGTSAAAALTSGAIAALMQAEPKLTSREAANLLLAHADDGGAPGLDPSYGSGAINYTRVSERHEPGIADLALGGVSLQPGTDSQLQLTVENRGTAQMVGASVRVVAGQNFDTKILVPPLRANESTGITLPLTMSQIQQQAGGEFEAVVTPGTGTDIRESNNSVRIRLGEEPSEN